LGYRKPTGRDGEYWFGKIPDDDPMAEPHDRKFVRVCCGVAMPIFDRQYGAVVVFGEKYSPNMPCDLTMLAAITGDWGKCENALLEYRKFLKFGQILCDHAEAEKALMEFKPLWYAIDAVPLISYVVPKYTITEVGRTKSDAMIADGRLHVSPEMRGIIDQQDDMSRLALQACVVFLTEIWPAMYPKPRRERGFGRPIGMEGL
jgi:hypothetical protein